MSLEALANSVIAGDANKTKELCVQLLGEGVAPQTVLDEGLLKGMEVVGRKFKVLEIYVPEVLACARAMAFGVEVLKPHMAKGSSSSKGTFVIGTVKGDIHDIGKNLVMVMFEGAGYKVVDLGINVPREKFIEAIKEYKPDILGLCALLTTTMPEMKKVIDAVAEAGLRDSVKIMVGGAPVTKEYADRIGADGFADNASEAVENAGLLIKR